ncbi:MAG: GSCFA domain-containing protein [Alphaproteobacteria bacterium]|nr:GSCFA domain-containing protein [Alphaproteobacteria bacterium]
MSSPYDGLRPSAYWKSGVVENAPQNADDLYAPKFPIARSDGIATAGSCFAQHIARHLRKNGFTVLDMEPAPRLMPDDMRAAYGFSLYSARYGNIYTARHLLQLARDAFSGNVDASDIWVKDGRFYDAIRPTIERCGFDSVEEALAIRRSHLEKVRKLFETMDVFVFTFGLTEAWVNKSTGRVYPIAPGTVAGAYDPDLFAFINFGFNEIRDDFSLFRNLVRECNPGVRFLLTVSPVPLTATASNYHVLIASTYSKSVLRSAAGALCSEYADIDYFPSYEIIATPWSRGAFYESNLRSVSSDGVATVMRVFFSAHGVQLNEAAGGAEEGRDRLANRPLRERRDAKGQKSSKRRSKKKKKKLKQRSRESENEVCDDLLLEAFAP